jgi:HPr kinase/phosphorylase
MAAATIHASVVLMDQRAVLIRGPAGAGKSQLAMALIRAAECGLITFARLVADDRVELAAAHGRLLARAPEALAGLIEVRGLGIRRLDYEPVAVIGLAVDLEAAEAPRLPGTADRETLLEGIVVPRLAFLPGVDPLPAVLGLRTTTDAAA